MNHSPLIIAQLNEALRSYALTVEEAGPGEFKWRILENHGTRFVFESVRCSDITFAAYDAALATGYGELQRLIGPDLQFGPRREPQAAKRYVKLVLSAATASINAPSNGSAPANAWSDIASRGSLPAEGEAARV